MTSRRRGRAGDTTDATATATAAVPLPPPSLAALAPTPSASAPRLTRTRLQGAAAAVEAARDDLMKQNKQAQGGRRASSMKGKGRKAVGMEIEADADKENQPQRGTRRTSTGVSKGRETSRPAGEEGGDSDDVSTQAATPPRRSPRAPLQPKHQQTDTTAPAPPSSSTRAHRPSVAESRPSRGRGRKSMQQAAAASTPVSFRHAQPTGISLLASIDDQFTFNEDEDEGATIPPPSTLFPTSTAATPASAGRKRKSARASATRRMSTGRSRGSTGKKRRVSTDAGVPEHDLSLSLFASAMTPPRLSGDKRAQPASAGSAGRMTDARRALHTALVDTPKSSLDRLRVGGTADGGSAGTPVSVSATPTRSRRPLRRAAVPPARPQSVIRYPSTVPADHHRHPLHFTSLGVDTLAPLSPLSDLSLPSPSQIWAQTLSRPNPAAVRAPPPAEAGRILLAHGQRGGMEEEEEEVEEMKTEVVGKTRGKRRRKLIEEEEEEKQAATVAIEEEGENEEVQSEEEEEKKTRAKRRKTTKSARKAKLTAGVGVASSPVRRSARLRDEPQRSLKEASTEEGEEEEEGDEDETGSVMSEASSRAAAAVSSRRRRPGRPRGPTRRRPIVPVMKRAVPPSLPPLTAEDEERLQEMKSFFDELDAADIGELVVIRKWS